jgi:hypothetical protein
MKTTMPHLEQQADGFILGSGDISKSDVYDLSLKRRSKASPRYASKSPAIPACQMTVPASRITKARSAASSSASCKPRKTASECQNRPC